MQCEGLLDVDDLLPELPEKKKRGSESRWVLRQSSETNSGSARAPAVALLLLLLLSSPTAAVAVSPSVFVQLL